MIPFEKVLSKAEEYKPKMSRFLRDEDLLQLSVLHMNQFWLSLLV